MWVLCPDFDLAVTLRSGQVFRWRTLDGGSSFTGWIDGATAQVTQQRNQMLVEGTSQESARDFFSLDANLREIARQIDVDEIIHDALGRYWGLRVIRQDPWECLASFILSSFNNIPRLTHMIEALTLRFGEPVEGPRSGVGFAVRAAPQRGVALYRRPRSPQPFGSQGNHARSAFEACSTHTPSVGQLHRRRFPSAERLAKVPERALRNCGLGFRAPYLKAAARAVTSGKFSLRSLDRLEDEPLRRALCEIPGVGEKVVECVMLFSYGRAAAFPVDVWIGRSMRAWYFRRRKVTDRQIREFARKHFGPNCGWAQQYLYCCARQRPQKREEARDA